MKNKKTRVVLSLLDGFLWNASVEKDRGYGLTLSVHSLTVNPPYLNRGGEDIGHFVTHPPVRYIPATEENTSTLQEVETNTNPGRQRKVRNDHSLVLRVYQLIGPRR